jgi:hypothetical protein
MQLPVQDLNREGAGSAQMVYDITMKAAAVRNPVFSFSHSNREG